MPKKSEREVWVYLEVSGNAIREVSLELMTPARAVAGKLGACVAGVLVGHGVEELAADAICHGADKVYVADDEELAAYNPVAYAHVVAELARKYKPDAIFVSATVRGREFAPYVSCLLETGITADCTAFDVDEDGEIVQIRPPFGAFVLAHIVTPGRRPVMSTVRPGVFDIPLRDEARRGEVVKVRIGAPPKVRMRLVGAESIERREEPPIERAKVLVAGGKGVGGKEGFKLLEKLASVLGGAVCGSRKAVDAGWIPHERQVGQSGRSVKPDLYIAVGISGAAQHVFGIREAKRVVCINVDPNAPIFEHSDYGVVGDYREIVPALIEELKRLRTPARA